MTFTLHSFLPSDSAISMSRNANCQALTHVSLLETSGLYMLQISLRIARPLADLWDIGWANFRAWLIVIRKKTAKNWFIFRMLKSFVEDRLKIYSDKRNDPNANALSNLSPWYFYILGHKSCCLTCRNDVFYKLSNSKLYHSYKLVGTAFSFWVPACSRLERHKKEFGRFDFRK